MPNYNHPEITGAEDEQQEENKPPLDASDAVSSAGDVRKVDSALVREALTLLSAIRKKIMWLKDKEPLVDEWTEVLLGIAGAEGLDVASAAVVLSEDANEYKSEQVEISSAHIPDQCFHSQ